MLELTMRLQEAEKNNLRAKSKKKMSLQDQKNITTQKLKFCLLETFRSAETLGPALTSSKPYIPDNSKPSSPGIDCKNVPKHLFFFFFLEKKLDFSPFWAL